MMSWIGKGTRRWGLGAVLMLTLALVGACSAQPVPQSPPKSDQPPTKTETKSPIHIGISQIVAHPSLDATRKSFKDEMTKLGYAEGKDVIYEEQNAQGDMATNASIAQKLATGRPNLIVAITTPVAQAMVKATEGSGIPVLFVDVTDPVAAGIVPNWDKPGGMVSGVSDMNPVDKVVKLVLQVKPGAKRIGIIHSSGEVNSKVQVDMAKKAVAGTGVQIVEAPVTGSNEVLTAAQSLVGRADAIMIPTDNTAVSALESILKVGLENKIPVITSDLDSVKRGSAAGLGFEYADLGKQLAPMVVRVLKEGIKPGEMAVQIPTTAYLAVNPKAAEAMGAPLPKEVVDKADRVEK